MSKDRYSRLADDQRFYIKTRLDQGDSLRAIAEGLGVAPSTISREVQRNALADGAYCPDAAGRKSRQRRKAQAPPCAMNETMRFTAGCLLAERWSPEQISGRMRRVGVAMACPNTIYGEIRKGRVLSGGWAACLRHGGKRRRKADAERYPGCIPDRVGIERRPSVVDARARVGDFEADLIVGKGHRGCLLTVVERRTGMLLAAPLKDKTAASVSRALVGLMRPVREHVRTITFDNGREFAWHKRVAKALGCETYFARPYHSWEKGCVENGNGLLRQYFPKGMPLDGVTRREVAAAVDQLNRRPRKRLGWDAPIDAFARETQLIGQTELWYKPKTEVLR